jgi:hypothetical protein
VLGLSVSDHEARAYRLCGELIDRIAAYAPPRKLILVEAFGHTRVPFRRVPAGSPRRGRAAAGHSVPPRQVRWVRKVLNSRRARLVPPPSRRLHRTGHLYIIIRCIAYTGPTL